MRHFENVISADSYLMKLTPKKMKMAISTVRMNIEILKIEVCRTNSKTTKQRLEFEEHILDLLEAEYEGRLHITERIS